MRDRTLPIARRLAEIACPPEVSLGTRIDDLLTEFSATLEVLPASARVTARAGLVIFDRAARLYPKARGRRFVRLADPAAESYLRAALARPRSVRGTAALRIKGVLVMCYYELPEVKEEVGYRPDAYIAAVSRRRLASYAEEIRAGEAAVLSDAAASADARRAERIGDAQ